MTREPMTAAEALGQAEADEPDGPLLVVLPNRVYEEGRRCCEPGCITILSRYNGGPDCFVHQDKRLARQRQEAAEAKERAA